MNSTRLFWIPISDDDLIKLHKKEKEIYDCDTYVEGLSLGTVKDIKKRLDKTGKVHHILRVTKGVEFNRRTAYDFESIMNIKYELEEVK